MTPLSIVLKPNPSPTDRACALCRTVWVMANAAVWLFREGTDQPICATCALEYAPDLLLFTRLGHPFVLLTDDLYAEGRGANDLPTRHAFFQSILSSSPGLDASNVPGPWSPLGADSAPKRAVYRRACIAQVVSSDKLVVGSG